MKEISCLEVVFALKFYILEILQQVMDTLISAFPSFQSRVQTKIELEVHHVEKISAFLKQKKCEHCFHLIRKHLVCKLPFIILMALMCP